MGRLRNGSIVSNPAPVICGYVLLLRYYDGSGTLGVWGPYASEEEAEAGKQILLKWPLQEGDWAIEPLFTPLA